MDQKLRSSIIMISFKPSQMSCCMVGASATCTDDAALDPQFSWRLRSGNGRWCGGCAAAGAAAAARTGKLSLARWPRSSTAATS
jgi:hypothetical protein